MKDKVWIVAIGQEEGDVIAPDPIEAATLYLEELTEKVDKFGIGILIKATDVFAQKDYYIRADLVLANAGMHKSAADMLRYYAKPPKKPKK